MEFWISGVLQGFCHLFPSTPIFHFFGSVIPLLIAPNSHFFENLCSDTDIRKNF